MRVTPRNELGQLVFLKKKKKIPLQEDPSCKVKKQRTELGSRLFPVLLEGLGLSRPRPPFSAGPQAGGDSLKPVLRSPASSSPSPSSGRRLGSLPSSGAASFGTETSRCPARRRSRAAAASPAPPTRPPGVWPPRCGSGVPSLPGPPRSPLSACAGLSLRRANTAQRAEPRGARRAAARAAGSRRGRSPRSSCGPTDARTMAAEGPGPGARLWAAALLLLGLPRLSTPANGECPWSVHEAAGPGWLIGSRWGKRSSPGLPPGTSPEHGHLGRERGERPSCHPASPLSAPRVASSRNAPRSPSTTPSCGARAGESLCFDLTALPLAFQDLLEKSAK